jgi:hypothetical protein
MDELWGGSGPPGPPPLIYATVLRHSIPREQIISIFNGVAQHTKCGLLVTYLLFAKITGNIFREMVEAPG